MKGTMKATKWCGKLSSNDTFLANSWFIGVKIDRESNTEGEDYHRIFLLSTMEK